MATDHPGDPDQNGELKHGRVAGLCLALTEPTLARAAELARANAARIDQVELRADFLDDGELAQLPRFPAMVGMPAILTIRRTAEGGRFHADERTRRRLIRSAAGAYRYVDLESDVDRSFDESVPAGTRVIRSLHDTAGVPEQIERVMRGLPRTRREIAKAAVTPRTGGEMVDLFECARRLGAPSPDVPGERILLGMGRFGLPTRILAAHLGNYLTFCSRAGRSAAPGHLDPDTMVELYRFRSIHAGTRVLGVVGTPLSHSRSPQIHNPALAAAGIDAVYVPIELDDLAEVDRLALLLPLDGCSVTIPHKAHAARMSDAAPMVRRVGACNTLVRTRAGWRGENTDVHGFLAPLRGMSVNPRRATVVGAGGAARAVAFALRSLGTELLILNRTEQRAHSLARDSGGTAGGLDAEGLARVPDYSELIVQTTSVGLPDNPGDPLAEYAFGGHELVYDLVYGEELTPVLRRARDAGCAVIDGSRMLAEQAYEQFRLFTGHAFPDRAKARPGTSPSGAPGGR